jgi:alcohol dehydrogenase, propanol-preferring
MVLRHVGAPLEWTELPDGIPGPGEIRVRVSACGVCRTGLHVVDGELPDQRVPIIPGHEVVGLTRSGQECVPWLGHTDGVCVCCKTDRQNLCDHPRLTGYTRDGGFATAIIADARFAFPLGEVASEVALAPVLCAGVIGWRSLRIAGNAHKLGLYGFGAAARIVAQVAKWQGRSVFAFTRPRISS